MVCSATTWLDEATKRKLPWNKATMDKSAADHIGTTALPCCAQCQTKMTLKTVQPDPKRADKELYTYVCGGCGLREIIEMPL